jgi:hypothetical protein
VELIAVNAVRVGDLARARGLQHVDDLVGVADIMCRLYGYAVLLLGYVRGGDGFGALIVLLAPAALYILLQGSDASPDSLSLRYGLHRSLLLAASVSYCILRREYSASP